MTLTVNATISTNKTLFVDYFGTTILGVNEDGDPSASGTSITFERQDDLIAYAVSHTFTTLILKRLDETKYEHSNTTYELFPHSQATLNFSYTTALNANGVDINVYRILAKFIEAARAAGIQHIAAADTPSWEMGGAPSYTNYFWDHIVEFNKHFTNTTITGGNIPTGYFDMLYGEQDYWVTNNPVQQLYLNFNTYFIPGLNHMNSVKGIANSSVSLIATYIGNLKKVATLDNTINTTPISVQSQADQIDSRVDWLYLEFYFDGNLLNNAAPGDNPLVFMDWDDKRGKRMEAFAAATATKQTVIIPFFSSSAGNPNSNSTQVFFGDYLDYDYVDNGGNPYFYNGSLAANRHGDLDDITSLFETEYTTANPYNLPSSNTTIQYYLSMKQLCETGGIVGHPHSITYPNKTSINGEGTSWFKYSTMPDAKYYLKFSDTDVIGVMGLSAPITINADDLILTGTGTATCNSGNAGNCNSLRRATQLGFTVDNYKWYYNGSVFLGGASSAYTFTPSSTTAYTYLTCEIDVTSFTNSSLTTVVNGVFSYIRLRKTFKIDPFILSPSDHFDIVSYNNPSCPDYNNGTARVEWSPVNNTNYQYYVYCYFKSTNTTSIPDAIASSCNNYTVSGLTEGEYTIKLYTGICSGTGGSITYSTLTAVLNASSQQISTNILLSNSAKIPTPIISASGFNEINCYTNLTTGTYSNYQWKYNGEDIPTSYNGTSQTPNISGPYGNGYYTVTVEDANGCIGTSRPFLLNKYPSPSISGSSVTCESNKTYVVNKDPNNATYSWSVPNGGGFNYSTNLNEITIVNWGSYASTGGTISCVVTNECGNSTIATYEIKGCCSPTTGVTDLNNYTISSSTIMNGSYHINGTLNVTSGTLTIDGADITFGDDAKILVANGCTLVVENSAHLYACDPDIMWQGIVLEDRAVLVMDEAMVENAITAVTCNGSEVVYNINSSLFNNNNVGILVNGDGSSTTFEGSVINSVFTSRSISYNTVSTLINSLKGTNNATNINSFSKLDKRCNVGIDVLNVGTTTSTPLYNLTIGEAGTFSSKGNIFDNCDYGVRTNKSNVEIVNNLFQQIEGGIATSKKTIGIGIYGANPINTTNHYSLKIGGSTTNEKNTFTDCGIGILSVEYTHTLIAHNDIIKTAGVGSYSASNYTGRYGIKLINKHRSNYNCNNNTLSNIYYGIEWSQNLSNDVVGSFNSNTIGTSSTGEDCYTAINLNGVGNFIDRSCEIEINGNTINGVLNGIKVANFKNADKINIKNNPYISLRNAQNSQYGILVTGTTNTNISDNVDIHSSGSSNKNITGIFVNNSLFSSINCNNISNIGTCVGFGGDCQNIINEGVLHRNNFSYYSTAVQILPLALLGTQGSSNNACDDEWNHTGLTSSSQDIINFSNPLDFKVRSTSLPYKPTFLLGNAIGFPLGSNSTVTCSGDPIKGSPLLPAEEKLRLTKLAINDIDYPVLAAENKWFYTQMAYEKLRVDTTLAIGDSILVAFRDSLEFGNIGKFYSVEQSIESGNWSTAETNNLAITFENHIEENLKKVNSYIIAYRADTTLGEDTTWVEDMLDNLVPIASECYTIGGPSVLSAKSMLSYFSNELFEESEDCFRALADSIVADSSNTMCGLLKSYYVPETEGATYTWTVPSGTSYIQSGNNISVNWGTIITSGGIITCLITDTLGNSSYSVYNQDALITAPTCVTVTANNTSCVTNSYLSWSAPSECAAGYYLMFGTNGGGSSDPYNITDTLDIGNVTTYSLPPYLLPNTIHYYKVIPYNNIHVPVSGCSIGSFTSGSSVAFTPTLGNPYIENFNGVTAPALPCGISVSNENFPQDNFKWETNFISTCSGNNSLTIAKNSNNTTAKNDWFYSHPLNLTAGELYRISYKSKAESSFTENLETYVAQSPDAATMLTTSTVINNSITSTNCISDSGDFIAPTSTVYYVGGHANSAAGQGTLYIDDLKVSLIKTTHLTTASCGDSLYTCDTLHCITYTGATSYKFRFENLNVSFSQDYTVTTANPKVYQFLGSNPLMLGQSYSVTVSAFVGGVWTPFGSACDVYVRPVPIRGLTGASCGGTLTDLSQLIYTNTTGICLINDYKYEFTDQSNNTVIETQRNSAVTSFLMTYITSPYVKYSTTYSVKVKLKIGSTWGEYGSACNVTTPASPLTKLANSYCDYTLPTFATPVNCVSVLGAQDYRYNIVGPNNYNRTFTRNSSLNNWYFTWTNSSPYMQANTTYDVKVVSRAGGVWSDYGDVCTITTPATLSRMADTTFLQQVLQPIFDMYENSLELSVFPNPISQEHGLSIELKGITEHNQKAEILIYNTLGERIYQSVTITKEENRLILKPEIKLSAGVYWVEANINNKKLHKRFVVQ